MEEHDGTHIGDQYMRDSTWNAATDITPPRAGHELGLLQGRDHGR